MVKIPSNLISDIQAHQSFVLFAHSNPDGDALGSLFGLADILLSLGKKVSCFLETAIPVTFEFLPIHGDLYIGMDALEKVLVDKPYGIALDCGDQYRLGMFREAFLSLEHSFAIDHHKSHLDFAGGTWLEGGLSSTGEMVYELSQSLGVKLSLAAAEDIYVAMVTDTGSFRFSSTTKRTHQIAGELLGYGVKSADIGQSLYDSWSLSRMRLMQIVLGTLDVSHCGRIASVYVNQAMLDEAGAVMAETEGFIDYPRSLKSTEVAVFFKDAGDKTISVSMRGKGGIDVAEIAGRFNGGGHKNAAGCRIKETDLESAKAQIIDAIKASLN